MKRLALFILLLFAQLVVQAVAQPVEEWVARYNGPANGNEYANAMALDNDGNVYVTGSSTGSGTSGDYTTVKYDPSGNQLWVARYDGPANGGDTAYAIALDTAGNVYVTGDSIGTYSGLDYATVKYDPSGNQLWVARYDGPASSTDAAYAMALDNTGNVYVTGYSAGSGANGDYATVKYDPSGNQLWVARYDGPANDIDATYAMALDSAGNVYVTGVSFGSGTRGDYATVKYDPSGNQLWVARYDGPANSTDEAYAMALDSADNVYVTGYSAGSGANGDYATVKYDSSGNQLWVARYNGPANDLDYANAIALDRNGNVYVTGYSDGSGTVGDYATVKYDPSGNQLWVARYDGSGNTNDIAEDLAMDSAGNVYVTGYSERNGSGTSGDYATVKYDPSGNQIWVARYNGPTDNWARALAVDSAGNVYVTGRSIGSSTSKDYATIKYIQTQAPVAKCQNVTVSTDRGICDANASVDDGSYDPDDDPITLAQEPAGPYTLGDTLVTLTVTDSEGASDSCEATVTVVDQEPPRLRVSLSPKILWPPNHKMVLITASVHAWVSWRDVTDACDPNPAISLESITMNEGDPTNDVRAAEFGTDDREFLLRAEREGSGNGRVYTVTYTAADASGNAASASATVTVPHIRNR